LIRFLPFSNFIILLSIVVYANILLAVFNLIPIPPLDGSRILFALLPRSLFRYQIILERYGFWIILLFVFFGFSLISHLIDKIFILITGLPAIPA